MKQSFSRTRNMYQTVLNILQSFFAIWSVYLPFDDGVTLFKGDVTDIDALKAKQEALLKGFAITRKNKKKGMANLALTICKKVRGYAADVGNTTLFNNLRISYSRLFYSPDNTSISYAEQIYTAVNAMSAADKTKYNITAGDILALRTAIDEFMTVPSAEQVKKIRKTLTADIAPLFKQTTAVLTDKLDNLISEFRLSNPDLYAQYLAARRTYTSHRHTTIEVETIDAETGADLPKVKVLIESGSASFEDITDVQGKAKQQIEPEVNYSLKFILPDYEMEEVDDVNLNRGKHEVLVIKMKKVTPP